MLFLKKALIGFSSALLLALSIIVPGFGTNSQAHAASLKQQQHSSVEQEKEPTQETKISNLDLQSLDQYVKVVNNKYVLSIPNDVSIRPDAIKIAQDAINKANLNVISNESVINPITKEYNIISANNKNVNSLAVTVLAKSRPAHEVRNYWWGARHIFRTQGAVDDYVYQLNEGTVVAGLIALVPGGGVIGVLTGAKLQVVSLDLQQYKSKHKKNKIYMDVNLTLHTSFGVWND
ncbi:MAG: hypothetical protein ACE3JK_11630 [Sporolactobacillus sp.]